MDYIPICTIESVKEVILRDDAILLEYYNKISRSTTIHFICKCGEQSTKNCLQLVKVSGAFCKDCTRKRWTEKIKKTNIEKYGVECTVHAPKIKQNIQANLLEKYGVDHIFKAPEIKAKIKETMKHKYGVDHCMKSDIIKAKLHDTIKDKYGVENLMCLEEIKEKIKKTNMERYGVENILQNPDFIQKVKNTILNKYGVDHISKTDMFKEKVKETFMHKYGVSNPNKTKEIRDKIKQTNLKRYGVENPAQSKEIMEKTQRNAKKYKEYTLPSGKIIKVQGYEPFALDYLIKIYKEEDILTDRKDIPRITYNVNSKTRYYFPDIYIKSENKIIEVKSTWTYKCKSDFVQQKAEATKDAGYNYEIWIYDEKGNKIPESELIPPT